MSRAGILEFAQAKPRLVFPLAGQTLLRVGVPGRPASGASLCHPLPELHLDAGQRFFGMKGA
jgi:hypothetical protein